MARIISSIAWVGSMILLPEQGHSRSQQPSNGMHVSILIVDHPNLGLDGRFDPGHRRKQLTVGANVATFDSDL